MKLEIKEKVNRLLKAAKMKRTQPRKTILEAMLHAHGPQTADEIISATATGPNRVTVYRTLESLVRAGLVHKAFLDGRSRHYELADRCSEHQCHAHFVCTDCGRTKCLPDVSLPMAENPPPGFVIHRQQIRLEGLCPECSLQGR